MKLLGTIYTLFVVSSLALFGCTGPDSKETPGEKAEWVILQTVESENRSTQITTPIFLTIQDHEVMGVRGFQNQNIWVLLKVESPPYYKQIPKGNYELSKEVIDQLVKEHHLSYTVKHALESHMSSK